MIRAPRLLAAAAVLLAASAAQAETKGPYEVKSGVIETTWSKFKATQVIYFDDYGLKRAEFVTTDSAGGARHALKIFLPDGTVYDINLDAKTGMVRRMAPQAIAASGQAIDPAIAKNVKDLPDKTLLGKTCKGRQGEAWGMTVRAWTWKGVPLMTETSLGADAAKTETVAATKFTEGAAPADKFAVPAGVKIEKPGEAGN